MNYLKKTGISLLYSFIFLFSLTFFITLLNYFNILNYNLLRISKFIIVLISFFIGGFIIGKKSKKRRWLEGIKFGIICLFIFLLVNLFLNNKFELKDIIYYLVILSSTTIGSMLNINNTQK